MALRCLIVDDNAGRDEVRALPDVVLIDIDLRGESGLAPTGRLGEGRRGAVVPHVILISTHDEREYADLIEASPAVGFQPFRIGPHSRHNAATAEPPPHQTR